MFTEQIILDGLLLKCLKLKQNIARSLTPATMCGGSHPDHRARLRNTSFSAPSVTVLYPLLSEQEIVTISCNSGHFHQFKREYNRFLFHLSKSTDHRWPPTAVWSPGIAALRGLLQRFPK